MSTDTVHVLDASSIIQVKHDVGRDNQWAVLTAMASLVKAGKVAFPREVVREVKEAAHPDAPGVWVAGVERDLRFSPDPSDETLSRVMKEVGDVVDPDKTLDGDPYVLAQALELSVEGHDVVVVTEDVNDRPGRLSLRTASKRMGLKTVRLGDFLEQIEISE